MTQPNGPAALASHACVAGFSLYRPGNDDWNMKPCWGASLSPALAVAGAGAGAGAAAAAGAGAGGGRVCSRVTKSTTPAQATFETHTTTLQTHNSHCTCEISSRAQRPSRPRGATGCVVGGQICVHTGRVSATHPLGVLRAVVLQRIVAIVIVCCEQLQLRGGARQGGAWRAQRTR